MGQERTIPVSVQNLDWVTLVQELTLRGGEPILRMIDGLPAFPNEVPDSNWRELRLSVRGGMVTLRRVPDGIQCVVWGDASPSLLASRDLCCEVIAELGT